jgi:DNA-binding CsgD family transcriptional regulator
MEAGVQARGEPDFAEIDNLAALGERFGRAMRPYGFSVYAAGSLTAPDPGRPFILINWPREWLELYAAQGFAGEDIVVATALQEPEPFTWGEVKARHPGASQRVFEASERFGWRDGFVVPVHGPGQERGIVSLAGWDIAMEPNDRATVAQLAVAAYRRGTEILRRETRRSMLSARERETLRLVAEGLDDGLIAERLNVSRSTAHFHVENAKRRLGATSRAHAVAIALRRGIIG